MGAVEDIFEDLDADVSLEEFREAVAAKVEQMGGLADDETAAMLIAHEVSDDDVNGIADIEADMEEVSFLAKVTSIGELRSFERDDGEDGAVVNVELADETGSIRAAFWDDQAVAVDDELDRGVVLRVKGRPKDGLNGVEVNVSRAEADEDETIDVQVQDVYAVEDLSLGLSDVNVKGSVLDTGSVRTFDRDDGSEGRVANVTLGDETGRVRVTLWDDATEYAESLEDGVSVEVVDGYVRERDGSLELHVGNRGAIEELEETIEYVPDSTDIDALELGDVVDITGVVRTVDPVRTFDRDDGSEGKVRNVRVQDDTGDIRAALWGEKAETDVGPGDVVYLGDVQVKEGWQEDLEVSAGWRSTISVLDGADRDAQNEKEGLAAFSTGGDDGNENDINDENDDADDEPTGDAVVEADDDGEVVEFTGTVVQTGDPVMLDNGEDVVRVKTSESVSLGEEITVRGTRRGDALSDVDVF